jgi:hypothetical protein
VGRGGSTRRLQQTNDISFGNWIHLEPCLRAGCFARLLFAGIYVHSPLTRLRPPMRIWAGLRWGCRCPSRVRPTPCLDPNCTPHITPPPLLTGSLCCSQAPPSFEHARLHFPSNPWQYLTCSPRACVALKPFCTITVAELCRFEAFFCRYCAERAS